MRRVIQLFAVALFLVALASPPWLITWNAGTPAQAPNLQEVDWGGFHPWTYARSRPTKTIAWDGPSSGGHVDLTGEPRVLFPLWFALLSSGLVVGFFAGRRVT
jgi:hypothetical protein